MFVEGRDGRTDTVSAVKHRVGSEMLWRLFSALKTGNLVWVEWRIKKEKYDIFKKKVEAQAVSSKTGSWFCPTAILRSNTYLTLASVEGWCTLHSWRVLPPSQVHLLCFSIQLTKSPFYTRGKSHGPWWEHLISIHSLLLKVNNIDLDFMGIRKIST